MSSLGAVPGAAQPGAITPGSPGGRITGSTSTVTWRATPDAPRWTVVPARRWTVSPAVPRWRIAMTSFSPIAAISRQEVNVTWTSDLDGTSVDPTGQTSGQPALTVQMAFPVSSGMPAAPAQPVTWYAASWLLGGTGKGYVAQCLVGPGSSGPTLTAGQKYDVWCQILGSPEQPAVFAGTLAAY